MKKTALIFILILGINIANAQVPTAQAAYIYTISKFMKWPDEYNQGNFVIGVYTNDPVVSELKKIAKTKKYVDRDIEIKVFNSIETIEKTHVLYIPTNKTSDMKEILNQIRKNKTVVIGNDPDAIKFGAGINFVTDGNNINYEVKSINIIKKDIQVIKKVELMASKVY